MNLENTVIAPLVIALLEVVKPLGLPLRFIPLTAVALGVALAYLLHINLLEGLIYGLTAVGLFSGTRATIGK